MSYYFAKKTAYDFNETIRRVTEMLKAAGFGIITEIDVQKTMKEKLDIDIAPYRILGTCNPLFAYKALQVENKVGTMLPCNVVVQELQNRKVEVAAVDPVASMSAITNNELRSIANKIQIKLKTVIEQL